MTNVVGTNGEAALNNNLKKTDWFFSIIDKYQHMHFFTFKTILV
jgi:polyisoprenoid-binding protein YceI